MAGVDLLWLGVIHLDLSMHSTALVMVGLALLAFVLLALALCLWMEFAAVGHHCAGFPQSTIERCDVNLTKETTHKAHTQAERGSMTERHNPHKISVKDTNKS